MKLILAKDDGEVIETWYVPDEEFVPALVENSIENNPDFDVWPSRESYEGAQGEPWMK